MIEQKSVQSTILKNKDIYFENIIFKRTGNKKTEPINVGFAEKHIVEKKSISIKLFCKVEQKDFFILELCLVGSFAISGDFPSDKVLPNAIAIMFPYLRSQISLMTAQPNISTIVLPAININNLLKKQMTEDNNK